MPTQISRPGAILRRGADKLTAAELKVLMDSPEQVDRIIQDINARRDVFFKTEAAATAALKNLEAAQSTLAEGEATLAEGEVALSKARTEAAEKHASDMEALGRRTREVVENEGASDERAAGLATERAAVASIEAEIVRFRTRLDEAVSEFHSETEEN